MSPHAHDLPWNFRPSQVTVLSFRSLCQIKESRSIERPWQKSSAKFPCNRYQRVYRGEFRGRPGKESAGAFDELSMAPG